MSCAFTLERKGVAICMADSVEWRKYGKYLMPDTLPHENVEVDEREIRKKIRENKIFYARWTNNFDCQNGEYWYVIKDNPPSFEELSSKTRYRVRKGFRDNEPLKVDVSFIRENCYEVYRTAVESYEGKVIINSREEFERDLDNVSKKWNCEFFAVLEKESQKPACYAINIIEDNICLYSTIKISPEFRKNYCGYALIFFMNDHYLNGRGFRYVSDGARSLYHVTNIQSFLVERFLFRKAYCRLNVVYSPGIGLLVRLAYPFRKMFMKSGNSYLYLLSGLLKHEEIMRIQRRSGIK